MASLKVGLIAFVNENTPKAGLMFFRASVFQASVGPKSLVEYDQD